MIKRADVTLGMNLGEGSGVCYTEEISGQEAICHEQWANSQHPGGWAQPGQDSVKYELWARLPGAKALGGGKVQLGNAAATAPVRSASGCCNVNSRLISISVKKGKGARLLITGFFSTSCPFLPSIWNLWVGFMGSQRAQNILFLLGPLSLS